MHIGVTVPLSPNLGLISSGCATLSRPWRTWGMPMSASLTTSWALIRSSIPRCLSYPTHKSYLHEPLTFMSYLAGITRKLQLVTAILILPQRQTALVAKQAAEVDVLSGGRLRLGIGVGWNPVEYEALGENFHNRGRRCEEQIAVLRALWTQEVVSSRESGIRSAMPV